MTTPPPKPSEDQTRSPHDGHNALMIVFWLQVLICLAGLVFVAYTISTASPGGRGYGKLASMFIALTASLPLAITGAIMTSKQWSRLNRRQKTQCVLAAVSPGILFLLSAVF